MAFHDLDSFQEKIIISLVELMSTGRYHSDITVRYSPQISDALAYTPERWELELPAKDGTRPYSLDLYQSDNLSRLLSCGYLEMKAAGEGRTAKLSAKGPSAIRLFQRSA